MTVTMKQPTTASKRILLVVGEASGDLHGAHLARALREKDPTVVISAIAGEGLRREGVDVVFNVEDIAGMGLTEVAGNLKNLWRAYASVKAFLRKRRPDLLVAIDFPDFNFQLLPIMHALGVPVVYYVSPQLWAWRTGRIEQVKKYVRKMIVIFPFEQEFYRKHGVDVAYVGHPLAFLPLPQVSRPEFAAQYKLDPTRQWLAILPGSRRKEVRLILPVMLEAVEVLRKQGNDFEYLLPVASTLDREWVRYQLGPAYRTIKLTENAQATVMHSRAAVVASGTATVETALTGTPFIVVYRLSALTWLLGRRMVKLDTFAMPNLIAGKKIVPELIQGGFTADALVRELSTILADGPARLQMQQALSQVKEKLRDTAHREKPAVLAAREILNGIDAFAGSGSG